MSSKTILLVAPSGDVAATLTSAMAEVGCPSVLARSFEEAKTLLTGHPKLLITEVRLGAYNGLHLAIRADAIGTPAVVIGEPDVVLERDAQRLGAVYLTLPLDRLQTISVTNELANRVLHERRSPRRRVGPVEAFANDWGAQLVDVSYEGMRLEADSQPALPRYFEVRLPQFQFACQVERIWTAPSDDNASHLRCGAELFPATPEVALEWRALVDALPKDLLAN